MSDSKKAAKEAKQAKQAAEKVERETAKEAKKVAAEAAKEAEKLVKAAATEAKKVAAAAAKEAEKLVKAAAKEAEKIAKAAAKADGVDLDERHTATAICKAREIMMCQLFNQDVEDSALGVFPCAPSVLRDFRATVLGKFTGFIRVVQTGGLNGHYDLEFQTETKIIRVELKVKGKGKGSLSEKLKWSPWIDTVQFLQGQITSALASRFLQECGEPMIHAWFHSVVLAFSSKVPEAAGMTLAGYQKVMMAMNVNGKQEDAAKAFITALRAQKSLRNELRKLWIQFEEQWLPSHELNHAELESVIREILESKDAWICASKNKIEWVEGLKVIGLEYTGVGPKPKGGMLFTYNLTLQSGDETKIVPIKCKFYWKNGGQGTQNINFLLL